MPKNMQGTSHCSNKSGGGPLFCGLVKTFTALKFQFIENLFSTWSFLTGCFVWFCLNFKQFLNKILYFKMKKYKTKTELPPPSRDWSASSVSPCPLVCGGGGWGEGKFQVSPGELPRLQTNPPVRLCK